MSMAAVISAVQCVKSMSRRAVHRVPDSTDENQVSVHYEGDNEYTIELTFRVRTSEDLDIRALCQHIWEFRNPKSEKSAGPSGAE